MAIVVIGLNHRTAPLDVLERVTLNGDARAKALVDLRLRPNLSEVVLLSTCNRTEVYAVTERFHGAYADIRDFFCDLAGLAPDELALHLVSQYDEEAATHLFEVAAGLRLGRAGRVRDPRPGPRRVDAGPAGGHAPRLAEPALPAGARGRQAGAVGDRRSAGAPRRSRRRRSRWPRSASGR